MRTELRLSALLVALSLIGGTKVLAETFLCSGTEPFWDLSITNQSIQLRNAGDSTSVRMQSKPPRSAVGVAPDYVRVYETRTVDEFGKPVTIVIQASAEAACSDNMSDKKYPYYVVVIMPQKIFSGCCTKK